MRRDLFDLGSRSTYGIADIVLAVVIGLCLAAVLLHGLGALFL